MPTPARADHTELLEIAERLARGAGALTVRLRGGDRALDVAAKSSPTDLVTEVDRASERWLADELARLRPDDALLGEEGAARTGASGVRWVVDPIDGTVNFLYGLRPYAVSVAAERDGRVVAGCVHDPTSGDTFTAALGAGAYLDGSRIGGRWVAAGLATAVVATGFGYDAAQRAAQGEVLARVLPRVGNVRRLGSAALDLCYVAAGRLDGYFEHGLKDWDRAAGLLVATEAGALVGGLHGRPPGRITVAASPAVAADLTTLLQEVGADRL
ncbi:MAG TPA: inositol monophosphatase family protein [Mycobacteriales bacterium]|nr:inositol monophosphatase family protein [Mycobacteriales bacterium]